LKEVNSIPRTPDAGTESRRLLPNPKPKSTKFRHGTAEFKRADLDPVRDLFRLVPGTVGGKGPGGVYGKLECIVCNVGQKEEADSSCRRFQVNLKKY
jgi:hypothetical protein